MLAVTGLAAEARLAAGPGVTTIMAGGNPARLRSLLCARVQPDCRAVISVGIAGGLDPSLVPGDVIVATGVAAPDRRHVASPLVAQRLAARLSGHPKRVILADLAGVDSAVVSPLDKRALRNATGALAVDMESHVAAAFAAQHGLPFAAVRVVCDPAHRALPALIATALRPDGEVSLSACSGACAGVRCSCSPCRGWRAMPPKDSARCGDAANCSATALGCDDLGEREVEAAT